MDALQRQAAFPSSPSPVIQVQFQENAIAICAPSPGDALAVKALMDRQAPEAKYAAYYNAMALTFMPTTSCVAKDRHGNPVGAIVGMESVLDRKLHISHIVVADTVENRPQILTNMLQQVFAQADRRNLNEVKASLDIPLDLDIRQAFKNAHDIEFTVRASLNFSDSFKDSGIIDLPPGLDVDKILYRPPTIDDAAAMRSIVLKTREDGRSGLDLYALSNYTRLCRDFSQTCAVAEIDGHIVGFATGYMMPQDTTCWFLWQAGVHPSHTGKKIGSQLQQFVIDKCAAKSMMYTVEANNGPAKGSYASVARSRGWKMEELGEISAATLGHGHPPEIIFRIG